MATPPAAWLTVQTTTDSEENARALARGALSARLSVCVQVSAPVTSVHHWQNALETAEERCVLFRTRTERYVGLEEHLRAAHDYDTPDIIATPIVRGSARYLARVADRTSMAVEL